LHRLGRTLGARSDDVRDRAFGHDRNGARCCCAFGDSACDRCFRDRRLYIDDGLRRRTACCRHSTAATRGDSITAATTTTAVRCTMRSIGSRTSRTSRTGRAGRAGRAGLCGLRFRIVSCGLVDLVVHRRSAAGCACRFAMRVRVTRVVADVVASVRVTMMRSARRCTLALRALLGEVAEQFVRGTR